MVLHIPAQCSGQLITPYSSCSSHKIIIYILVCVWSTNPVSSAVGRLPVSGMFPIIDVAIPLVIFCPWAITRLEEPVTKLGNIAAVVTIVAIIIITNRLCVVSSGNQRTSYIEVLKVRHIEITIK